VADIIGDGRTRVDWVPTIADIEAPTAAEINAGVRVSQWMTKDGLVGFQPETADAPTSGIESTFDTAVNGRRTFSGMMLRLKKQTGTDTAYDTLLPDTTGYVVIRRSVAATTAIGSGQKVQVYPVMVGEARWLDPEDNMPERYEIPLKPTAEPSLRAEVA
jgi:hypothetical protein